MSSLEGMTSNEPLNKKRGRLSSLFSIVPQGPHTLIPVCGTYRPAQSGLSLCYDVLLIEHLDEVTVFVKYQHCFIIKLHIVLLVIGIVPGL